MRKVLDSIHVAAAVIAAIATVSIGIVVFVQVGGRLLGIGVRGADDLVAWLTACASLCGIGYAFRQGSHVRVDLLVDRLAHGPRHVALVAAGVAGVVISGYAAYACTGMVVESFTLGDVSQGDIPVKLWIPQLGIAIGTLSLALAVLEHVVLLVVRGAQVAPAARVAAVQEI